MLEKNPHSDSTKKVSESDTINIFELLIDNIFVIFGGRVFQQTVGIPIGTNCAPLLTDLFLYSHEVDFKEGLLKKIKRKLALSFNLTFRYIDDVLSLNNYRFGDVVDRIYPIVLEIKDTTYTDDFNFPIVNFSFICSNIPAAPAYGVYISQLIRYSRACGSYQDFLDRGWLLTRKLLNQGCVLVKWKSSPLTFYGRHHDSVDRYGISVSQMTTDMFHLSKTLSGPFLIHDLLPGM